MVSSTNVATLNEPLLDSGLQPEVPYKPQQSDDEDSSQRQRGGTVDAESDDGSNTDGSSLSHEPGEATSTTVLASTVVMGRKLAHTLWLDCTVTMLAQGVRTCAYKWSTSG